MNISEKDRNRRKKIGAALCAFFFLLSLGTIGLWYSQVADSIRSLSWPMVQGVVVQSEMKVFHRAHGRSNDYNPSIEYIYTVDGTEYTASKLQYIQDGFGKDWALDKVAYYGVDQTVQVYHDPGDPQVAVLEPGGQMKWYLFLSGTALAFLLVFAGLAGFFFKDYRKMVAAKPLVPDTSLQ
jgi:hypothetical protein